jgi:hypothetical protein
MPEFKNRDEYEKWKNEKIKTNLEKLQRIRKDEEKTEIRKTPPQEKQPLQKEGGLKPLAELFSDSWELFKVRFITLFCLYLLSAVFLLTPLAIFTGIGFIASIFFPENRNVLIAAGLLIGMTPGFIAMFWGTAAFTCAVSERTIGIKDALERGWKKVWSFIWLFSILSFIVTGGFLLFLIPGIIFLVWFIFSQFILVSEGNIGMDAMLRSKEYVKGNWFDVFLRLFVIGLIYMVVNMVPFIGPILSIVFFPFMMIFIYLIYHDLKELKGNSTVYSNSTEQKFKWILLGTLGYIVLPLIIIGFLGIRAIVPFLCLKGY